ALCALRICVLAWVCHRVLYARSRLSFPTRRSSDLAGIAAEAKRQCAAADCGLTARNGQDHPPAVGVLQRDVERKCAQEAVRAGLDRKSTRLNSSHVKISYAVLCLKKKNQKKLSAYE